MKAQLTRRSFGALTVGLAATALPGIGLGKDAGYAQPHLLMAPEALIGALSSSSGSAPVDGGLVVVDIRSREAYDEGHIAGALQMDPNAVAAPHSPVDGTLRSTADIEAMIGALGVSAGSRVVFYDDRGGFHAARMLWLMEYLGHRNAAVLNGGWSAWQALGGPTSPHAAAPDAAVFQAAVSPRRHATAEDVLAHRDAPGRVLIDVRPPHLYAKGHIPWAINVPWSQNLGEDGRFLPAGKLLAHFERHGVTPESDVVMHCQNGLASAHSYVALRVLGMPRVRVYHRSWAEWGSDPSLPKVTA